LRILGLALAAMLALQASGLEDRIRATPALTPDERQAVAASFSQKNFERLEAILAADAPPERAAPLRALLGALEFVSGRMIQAIQYFRQSDLLRPLDDHDRFTLAMALVDLGDSKESRIELSRLNQSHPDQPIYLYWLARLDYGQRLYDAAVEKLQRVIQLEPNSVRGHDNLGLTYDMMGLNDEALNAFLKAVDLNSRTV